MVRQHLIQGASRYTDCQRSATPLFTDSGNCPQPSSFLQFPSHRGEAAKTLLIKMSTFNSNLYWGGKKSNNQTNTIWGKKRLKAAHRKSTVAGQYGWNSAWGKRNRRERTGRNGPTSYHLRWPCFSLIHLLITNCVLNISLSSFICGPGLYHKAKHLVSQKMCTTLVSHLSP